ncbi:MAG: DUF2298 domain-containing protein [Anaerolineae bacterium]|nr:DUF2298 domain-containing protein [Anaerolineae bacterium]
MASVLAWWVLVTLVGWTALPVALRLFNRLPGRGYALAKALGLLLVAYVFWLLCSLKLLPNSAGGILVAWAAVLALSVLFYRRGGGNLDELRGFVREQWRYIVATEAIFLVGLAGWALFRAFDPDLVGTEKPMEFAFLNAILRSDTFPPHDPWLSGYAISYYYFGYVIVAMLTKLAGTIPAAAFNVGIALLFALTLTGSFGVVYELIGGKKAEGRAIGFSLFGPVFVALVGNLEGLLDALHSRGIGSAAFWKWVQIKGLADAPVTGSWIPQDHWWWWRASRVVYDTNLLGEHQEVIDEFPYFSFILGDMHPHVLALPFVMLAIALAVQVIRWAAEQKPLALPKKGGVWAWLPAYLVQDWERNLLIALCLGALGFLNTWDFPIYWAVVVLCYAAGRYAAGRRLDKAYLVDVAVWAGRALILGVLLFLPFYVGFGSQASGIGSVIINKTRPWHYFVMFGLFLSTSAAFLVYATRAWVHGRRIAATGDVQAIGVVVAVLALVSLVMGKWTALGVIVAVGVLAVAVTRRLAQADRTDEHALTDTTVALMMIVGFLLTFAVEFVFLRDYFGTRMNTVFKFYYQAWVLLGLSGAYALWAIFGLGAAGRSRWARVGRGAFAAVFAVLLAASLVYTFAAGYSKAGGFRGEATLNCLAFVQKYYPAEYDAIQWLNANAQDAPVILEATGGSYSEAARVSARTGLPTVLGWDFHEQQWRGKRNPAGSRASDVERIYLAPDSPESLTLLDTYGISYIYIGDLERSKYGLSDAVVNRWDSIAVRVYNVGGVRIYRYPR